MKTASLPIIVALLAFSAGCAAEPAPDDDIPVTGDDQNVEASTAGTSAYTKTEPCTQTLDEDEGEAYSWDCTGIGGWIVGIDSRDSYLSVSVKRDGKSGEAVPLEFSSYRSLGPNVEWRVPKNAPTAPYAVGIRVIDVVEGKNQHALHVTKLNGDAPCLFAIVEASKQSAKANEISRKYMDRAKTEACPATPIRDGY